MNTTPDIESTFKNDLATETRTIPNNTASETQATVGLHPKQSFNASNDDILEILSKVLVVGEVGVGKTSLVRRYVHNLFSKDWKPTVGVDFGLKVLQYDAKTKVHLQLWDIAGQERYTNMTRVYFKDATAAVIVFDVTRMNSFQSVKKWKDEIDQKVILDDGRRIPVLLIANKVDLIQISEEQREFVDKFSKENGFIGWAEVSALQGTNVDTAMNILVEHIVHYVKTTPPKRTHSKSLFIAANNQNTANSMQQNILHDPSPNGNQSQRPKSTNSIVQSATKNTVTSAQNIYNNTIKLTDDKQIEGNKNQTTQRQRSQCSC